MTARRWSLAFATVLLGSFPAQAKPELEWHSRARCPGATDTPDEPLPGALSREAVLRDLVEKPLARTDVKLDKVCSVQGKVWKSQKQPSVLAFVETALFDGIENGRIEQVDHHLRIGLYRQGPGGTLQLVAKTAQPVSLEVEAKLTSPDLAPYKLTPTEYAFGVRTRTHHLCIGGSGDNDYLEAFRVQGAVIRSILGPILMQSALDCGGSYHDDGTTIRREDGDRWSEAQISVARSKTGGIFDWKIKFGRHHDVLKWDGQSYQGSSPVDDVNNSR
jgi:hypothetical protein